MENIISQLEPLDIEFGDNIFVIVKPNNSNIFSTNILPKILCTENQVIRSYSNFLIFTVDHDWSNVSNNALTFRSKEEALLFISKNQPIFLFNSPLVDSFNVETRISVEFWNYIIVDRLSGRIISDEYYRI